MSDEMIYNDGTGWVICWPMSDSWQPMLGFDIERIVDGQRVGLLTIPAYGSPVRYRWRWRAQRWVRRHRRRERAAAARATGLIAVPAVSSTGNPTTEGKTDGE